MTEREEEELRQQIELAQKMLGAATIMLSRLANVLEQIKEQVRKA